MSPDKVLPKEFEDKALLWKFLSISFLYPEAGWKERTLRLLTERKLFAVLQKADLRELQVSHFRLFGPNPACPLELGFFLSENPFEQTRKVADMASFYKAFGVEVEEGQRPDSLPVAMEFLSYLEVKQWHANTQELEEAARTTTDAMAKFLDEFIQPALKGFCEKLCVCSDGFYQELGLFIQGQFAASWEV